MEKPIERMQTRERKPKTISDFSPPSSQTTKKTKKKQNQPKPKPKPNNEKKKPDNEKNKSSNTKNKSNPQPKSGSNKSIKTIEVKNNTKKTSQKISRKKKDDDEPSSSTVMPEKLNVLVSQEIWNSWSNIRRASFMQIMENPNTFFYRNRPPGDPQKRGPFTSAEEKQFIDRLKYFREELGVNDGYWGYFAVPILGRVGYQCSNFYRSLISSGKIIDSSYELMPDGKLRYLFGGNKIGGNKSQQRVVQILEEEANTFIKKCFANTKEGEVPQVSKPIVVKVDQKKSRSFKTETSDSENDDESESEKDGIFIEIGRSDTPFSQKNVKHSLMFNSSALNNGRKRISISDKKNQNDLELSGSRARRTRKSNFYDKSMMGSKGSYRYGRNKSYNYGYSSNTSHYSDTNFCPLVGAIDPFSNMPIERPMMDPNGTVMDRSSWKKIFHTKVLPSFDIAAFSMNDLIELNSNNFDEYRYYITNFVC